MARDAAALHNITLLTYAQLWKVLSIIKPCRNTTCRSRWIMANLKTGKQYVTVISPFYSILHDMEHVVTAKFPRFFVFILYF